MEIALRKINFVQEFLRIQDENIISDLEKLLLKTKTDLYEKNLKPMSIEQYNSEIEQSADDIENGRIITAEELITKIKQWS
jgi:hypothetical protein